MRKFLYGAALAALLALASPAHAAPKHKHTIHASARPYKALGHVIKSAAVSVGTFSFTAFDTAVVDPLGVALQAFADGVDMFIAQPLEVLPKPLNYIGEGVHYVYLGVDKVGEILAR